MVEVDADLAEPEPAVRALSAAGSRHMLSGVGAHDYAFPARCSPKKAQILSQPSTAASTRQDGRSTEKKACPAPVKVRNSCGLLNSSRVRDSSAVSAGVGNLSSAPDRTRNRHDRFFYNPPSGFQPSGPPSGPSTPPRPSQAPAAVAR